MQTLRQREIMEIPSGDVLSGDVHVRWHAGYMMHRSGDMWSDDVCVHGVKDSRKLLRRHSSGQNEGYRITSPSARI